MSTNMPVLLYIRNHHPYGSTQPFLVDEIDTEEVKDQTANDVVGECSKVICQYLFFECQRLGFNLPLWRNIRELAICGYGGLDSKRD